MPARRRRLRLARLGLVACCALLSGCQCWELLRLFGDEPVSAATVYTPWEDVEVPAFTVCGTPSAWQHYKFLFGQSGATTVGRQLWVTGEPLKSQFSSCEPLCLPQKSGDYPGGPVEVGIGVWESWVSFAESSLCHTLTPNVTWGQLAQAARHKRFHLELKFGGARPECDYRLFVHPRRRPVVSSIGVRGVQPDLRQRALCRTGDTADQISFKLISRILDRETLHRAPCDRAAGYHIETCVIACAHRQWAARHNCSTPEMVRDYPQLAECSRSTLRRLERDGGLPTNSSECDCLPACRRRTFVADTGVETLPLLSHATTAGKLLTVQVSAASVAEEVTTERRSYRLASLLSEMGGFVSLVLGVSVLSLADTLTEAVTKTSRRRARAAAAAAADAPPPDTGDGSSCHPEDTDTQGESQSSTRSGSAGDPRRSTANDTIGRSKSSPRLANSLVHAEIRPGQGSIFTVHG